MEATSATPKQSPSAVIEQHLVALEFRDVIEEPRHADEAGDQHHGEEDGELEDLACRPRPACSDPVSAKPESSASRMMARMSSMTRMPKMISAKASRDLPSSASALTMMVVEEIESIAPRKTLSIVFQPKRAADLVAEPDHER